MCGPDDIISPNPRKNVDKKASFKPAQIFFGVGNPAFQMRESNRIT